MSNKVRNIKKDFLIVVLVVVFGKALGFLRELVVAYLYGASVDTDAFYYANSLITAIFTVITMGLGQAFTPTYLNINILQGKDASDSFASKIITILTGIGLIATLLLLAVPNVLLSILAPDLNQATQDIAAKMLRIMSFCVPLYIIFSIQKSILNAHEKYIVTEASGIPYSIAICLFTLLLNSAWGSFSLPIAAIAGVVFQFLFTYFFARKDYKYKLTKLNIHDQEVRSYFIMLMPIAASAVLEEANGLLRKALAGGMGDGAIANLSYCMTLTTLINGIVITSISTVYYPHLIKNYAEENYDTFKTNAHNCLSMSSVLVIPLVFFLFRYSNEVVQIIYERGNFTANDTAQVAPLFSIYVIGSIVYAYRSIIKTAFFATKNAKIPMVNEIIYLIICMLCNIIQVKVFRMGLNALGIAWLASIIVVTPILFKQFSAKYFSIIDRTVVSETAKSILSTIVFLLVLYCFDKVFMIHGNMVKLVLMFAVSLVIYSASMFILKSSTAFEVRDSIISRLNKVNKRR